jgi:hypothetical protein
MMNAYERKRSGFYLGEENLILAGLFFWGYALWPALLCLFARWTRWVTFAAALSALTVLTNALSSSERMHLHYVAPVVPLLVFLAVSGVRQMRLLRIGNKRMGRAMAEASVAVCLLSFTLACALRAQRGPQPTPVNQYRPLITAQLEATPGNDLVVVTYGPRHRMLEEWVYNGADLDGAPIVWARDMGSESNSRLLQYYAGRRIWHLFADEQPPRLEPYDNMPRARN